MRSFPEGSGEHKVLHDLCMLVCPRSPELQSTSNSVGVCASTAQLFWSKP